MDRIRVRINLLYAEHDALQALIDAPSTAQDLVRRTRTILLANGVWYNSQAIAAAIPAVYADERPQPARASLAGVQA